ncbi:MAG: SoxR reducing system RseC family protein [Deltaproteobacteria bacterium]|nr:SoxR reducing system RseC family protein [Deltaproteobacteria bacterium]
MATEKGIVTKIDSTTAWVKTTKTHACEGCEARASCNAMGGGKEMEVQAINYARAKVGEEVVLSFETSPLLKATFMLYVLPILFLMAGAFIGNKMAPFFNFDASLLSVITGFLFFGLIVMFVKSKGNKMAKKDEYRPKIIKIIKPV